MFQSAPAIDGGRSRQAPAQSCCVEWVSIRARHRWRAIRHSQCLSASPSGFQSAPAIDGGRSMRTLRHIEGNRRVSIRARHRWRAIPRPLRRGWRMLGFNPRPPSMAGDPVSPHGQHQPGAVSIRARHRWRAILACVIRGDFRCKFQSAPAIDGGRSPQADEALPLLGGVSIRARHRWRAILSLGAKLIQ